MYPQHVILLIVILCSDFIRLRQLFCKFSQNCNCILPFVFLSLRAGTRRLRIITRVIHGHRFGQRRPLLHRFAGLDKLPVVIRHVFDFEAIGAVVARPFVETFGGMVTCVVEEAVVSDKRFLISRQLLRKLIGVVVLGPLLARH